MEKHAREPLVLLGIAALLLVLSGLSPFDRQTWLMEVAPVLIGAPIFFFTYRRFPLTHLTYRLVFLFSLVLIAGGHWTYARVPLGEWIGDWFGFQRNHFDRIGHFLQGFVPAMLAREVLVRTSPLRPGKWLGFLVVAVCLAISACYEFIEWWAAVIGGASAEEFLGTQGDVWDAQWDMFLAMVGATVSVLLLSRLQDRLIGRLPKRGAPNADRA